MERGIEVKNSMKKRRIVWLVVLLLVVMAASPRAGAAGVDSKEDFYTAVNADWLEETQIPVNRSCADNSTVLGDKVDETLATDFAAKLSGEKQPDSIALRNFVEFYRMAMDFTERNAQGASPLLPFIERIETLGSLADLEADYVDWISSGMDMPFSFIVMADMGDASAHVLFANASSLCLPDKSYYEADNPVGEMLLEAYAESSKKLLLMAGKEENEATAIVEQALQFDALMVPYSKSAEETADYTAAYNPMDVSAFTALSENFDFAPALATLFGEQLQTIVVSNVEFFTALDELMNEDNFPALKSWMLVRNIRSLAPYLDDAFRIEAGSFGRILVGIAEPSPWEEAALYHAVTMYNAVVGDYYGRTYLGEEAKQDVLQMAETMVEVYKSRLQSNAWLSDSTREMAIRKLDTMAINIGYPDSVKPMYELMTVTPATEGGTFLSNAMDFTRIFMEDNFAKLGQPVDRNEWPMSAESVNARYSAANNSITFPAAILQEPYYSPEQSPSANYGGIGAVIAHEISHAFDPNGAKFDELGNMADWWTEDDYARYAALSQDMVEQFDGVLYAGGAVNGQQTLAENIADLGGLSCALEALEATDDVALGDFFRNWAVIWRLKATPEYEALLLVADMHAPNKLRANMQLQNIDAFFATFGISEGDGMYRAPGERIAIW